MNAIGRRLTRPVFLWPALALILDLFLSHQQSLLRLLPLIPMLLFVVALVRSFFRLDELQQRICVTSMSIAFLLTFTLTLIFDGLQRSGIHAPPWSELGTFMLILWGCAYVVSAWRYR